MKKPNQKDVIANDVKCLEIDKQKYFWVKDLLTKFPFLKVDTDKLIEEDGQKYVQLKDVDVKTDFDNKIETAFNFNPKGK